MRALKNLENAAYVAIGFGVIGFNKLQVRRHELTRQLRDLVERLLGLAGVDLAIEVAPERLRPVDVPDMRGDSRRLQDLTGWRPGIDLDRTLRDVLDYWRQEMFSGERSGPDPSAVW